MKQRRLNILFVTPCYPAEGNYSGIFVREYAKAVRCRHNVVVVHLQGDGCPSEARRFWDLVREDREAVTEGIPTYRVRYRNLLLGRGRNVTLLWAMLGSLREVARRHGRTDVIHAHIFKAGLYAAIAGKLCGIPTVVSEHWSAFPLRQLSRRDRLEARITFRLAERVLPVSEALRKAIERYGLRARFQVVPNVVNAELFAAPRRYGSCSLPARLLFVGTLTGIKGLPFLLQAVAQLRSQKPDVLLDIVGQGPEWEHYQRLTAGLGLTDVVTFHGRKSKQEIAEFFRGADVFVLPSLCETFSVATAEALMAGVPVVATRCGGPECLVTEKNGLLVPPADAGAMACALARMLGSLEGYDRAAIARTARERFGYETIAAALDEVYCQVTGSMEPSFERANLLTMRPTHD